MTRRTGSVVSAEPTVTIAVADQALADSGPSGDKAAKLASPPRCSLGALLLLRPSSSTTTPPPPAACADTRDNDGDGRIDMNDPGCTSTTDNDETNTTTPAQCADTRDNDGDALVDMNDPGCSGPSDNDETNAPLAQCADTRDNDGDALVDMNDPGCSGPSDNDETNAPLAQCADTRDNDGDGRIDMNDPGCTSPSDNDETNTTTPPPSNGVNCLISNRSQWSLAGTNCAYGTVLNFTNQQFRCDRPLSEYGPLPIKLVWSFTGNPDFGDQGHVDLVSGCRGDGNSDTVDLIVQSNADGVRLGAAGGAGKFRTAGPVDIQITGNFDCGPLGSSAAHQDGWQFHPDHAPARLDIVNGTSGNWEAGTSTCIGAGGAIFWSNNYDVDVYGGRYVSCNHGLFAAGQSRTGNVVIGAGFRTGRNDGTDPKCVGVNASNPCEATSALRLESVTCQRWDRATRSWRNVETTQYS
jgi:hypothetical protein